MRNLIILIIAFAGITGFIYSNKDFGRDMLPKDLEEPAVMGKEHPDLIIGKQIKKDKVTKFEKVVEVQNYYAMYRSGHIDFNELTNRTVVALQEVFIYPAVYEKGWLFSAGYEETSSVQVYAQSEFGDTRTVIYKVTYNEEGNKVEKIHDGKYFKLVSVYIDDPNYIIGYDENHKETLIRVGE